MGVTRTWLAETLRASAATMLVPGGILVALATVAVGGGLGGLGSLGQLVSGPRLPGLAQPTAPAAAHGATATRRAASLPIVPASRAFRSLGGAPRRARRGSGRVRSSPGHGHARGPGAVRQPVSGGRPVGVPGSGPGGRSGSGSGSGGQGSSPGPGSPPPAGPGPGTPVPSPSGVIQQAGQQAQGAAGALPGPAGPAASGAVGTVNKLVPPPHGRR
ncbi:MAG TPA: hypothetical protein VGY97_12035 [Solirubrobacteraceae bacterium]|nr:hypothetical protein [Solirubrobacteraceae bacterium]